MKVIVPVEHTDNALYFISQQALLSVGVGTHSEGHLEVDLLTATFPGAKEAFTFQLLDYLSERSNDPVQLIIQQEASQ